MTDNLTPEQRSYCVSRIRSGDLVPELARTRERDRSLMVWECELRDAEARLARLARLAGVARGGVLDLGGAFLSGSV